MNNRAGKPPSQRQLKVGEQIRKVLSDALSRGDFYDVLDTSIITITEVSISPDLRNAKAYIVSLNNSDTAEVLQALNDNAKRLKHYIAKSLHTRVHPNLSFELDTSFDYSANISSIVNRDNFLTGAEDDSTEVNEKE